MTVARGPGAGPRGRGRARHTGLDAATPRGTRMLLNLGDPGVPYLPTLPVLDADPATVPPPGPGPVSR